jgi:hypothetical protein
MSETVIQTQTNKFEHSSNTTAQDFKDATIEIQNNFYSSVIFKPMQINKNIKLRVFHNFLNPIYLSHLYFALFLSSFVAIALLNYLLGFQFNIKEYFLAVGFIFLLLSVFFLLLLFVMRYFPMMYLTIQKEEIILEQKGKNILILKYNEMRSLLKMKDLIGYSINLYKIDEIYPCLSFNIENIHAANAIEQLITSSLKNEKTI